MAGFISNNLITDSLVFYLDAGNTKSLISGNTNWNDLSQNNFNGIISSGATYNNLNNTNYLDFDGISGYWQTNSNFSLASLSVSSAITYSFWIKSTGNTNNHSFISNSTQPGTSGYVWIFRVATTNSISLQYANGSIASVTSLTNVFTGFNGIWVNLTFVVDYAGATCNWYRNGILIGTTIMTTPLIPPKRPFVIGAYNGAVHFLNGSISTTQIYSRALSTTEILQNYNASKKRYQ